MGTSIAGPFGAAPVSRAPCEANVDDDTRPPEWNEFLERLKLVGDDVMSIAYDSRDPRDRQETLNLLLANVARGYLLLAQADPDYPEFLPLFNAGFNVAAPNPDFIYYGAAMDGRGIYRLRGFTGTNCFTFLQFVSKGFADTSEAGGTIGSFALDDLEANSEGNFELILSARRPDGHVGNWKKLDPSTKRVFMRAAAYDWLRERDPVIGIERLDVPARRLRPSAERMAASLEALPGFVKANSIRWYRHMADLQQRKMENRIMVEPWGTFPGQTYLEGLYRLAEDEVLIVETDVPKSCRYWSFLVGDMQFRTIDWVNHQSSLNAFQAKLDDDGKFRAVISAHDPGVPNWLDTGGYQAGVIQGRWNESDSQPVPTTRLVKFAELRRHLPAETPQVSAEQRDRQLRDRRLGAQMRKKW